MRYTRSVLVQDQLSSSSAPQALTVGASGMLFGSSLSPPTRLLLFYHAPLSPFCSTVELRLRPGWTSSPSFKPDLAFLAVWTEKNVPRLSLKLCPVTSRIFAPFTFVFASNREALQVYLSSAINLNLLWDGSRQHSHPDRGPGFL